VLTLTCIWNHFQIRRIVWKSKTYWHFIRMLCLIIKSGFKTKENVARKWKLKPNGAKLPAIYSPPRLKACTIRGSALDPSLNSSNVNLSSWFLSIWSKILSTRFWGVFSSSVTGCWPWNQTKFWLAIRHRYDSNRLSFDTQVIRLMRVGLRYDCQSLIHIWQTNRIISCRTQIRLWFCVQHVSC
jgi:hypothetical protein